MNFCLMKNRRKFSPSNYNKLFKKGDVDMNYNDPKTTEMYVDFLWETLRYWQNIAAANKDELDYYRDLVKALVNGEMNLETLKELEGDDE